MGISQGEANVSSGPQPLSYAGFTITTQPKTRLEDGGQVLTLLNLSAAREHGEPLVADTWDELKAQIDAVTRATGSEPPLDVA